MLVETIVFEIRKPKFGIQEMYLVENTIQMQELVFSHRFTRDIHFTQTFDFQFSHAERVPNEIAFALSFDEANDNEFENEFDGIDEMVGMVF